MADTAPLLSIVDQHLQLGDGAKRNGSAADTGAWKADIFAYMLMFCQVMFIVLFVAFTDYDVSVTEKQLSDLDADPRVDKFYKFYGDVAIMLIIGFGYLMTFLRQYGYGAISYTYLLTVFVTQWSIIIVGLFVNMDKGVIPINIESLINGLFASAAIMISFGGVLGKTTPQQLLIIGLVETVFYALNYYVGTEHLKATDMGGSIFVHAFGAYFGLALARTLTSTPDTIDHKNNGSTYHSDLFSMIGTTFLWIYWPSFNGALAPPGQQFRVLVNTVLSLCASCAITFAFSARKGGKIDMVDVQNATLAGGVAMGTCADLHMTPGGALLLGTLGGTLSTIGFQTVSPWLEKRMGLQDTCGINNLHGMPAILSAVTSAVVLALTNNVYSAREYANIYQHGTQQPLYQIAALGLTLAIALASGALTGKVLSKTANNSTSFSDASTFELPDDFGQFGGTEIEEPYVPA